MKIFEELEDLKKELSSLEGKELVNDIDPDEIKEEQPTEEDSDNEEEKVKQDTEEKKPEEVKKEETEEKFVEDKPDASAFARMRRENAALKKKLSEKNEAQKEVTEDTQNEEANRILVDVIKTVQEQKAEKEFANLELSFAQVTPDFEDVSQQYKTAVYQSLRVQNPRESHASLLEKTKKTLLMKASQYINEGLDPIQEMYEEAKALGFKALTKEEKKPANEEKIRPDLDRVAANRARNAGTVGAKGASSGGQLTRAAAADLPAHEWVKLPIAERQRIMRGG